MLFILVYILFEWPLFKSDSGERYMLSYFMSLLPSVDFFRDKLL